MQRMAIQNVRKNFADVMNLVANAKQRILIEENQEGRAALIPVEDLVLLESIENGREAPVEHVSVSEVRAHLEKDLAEVATRAERIVLREDGQDVAALVPGRDYELLENLDDRLGLEAAKRLLERGNDDDYDGDD